MSEYKFKPDAKISISASRKYFDFAKRHVTEPFEGRDLGTKIKYVLCKSCNYTFHRDLLIEVNDKKAILKITEDTTIPDKVAALF